MSRGKASALPSELKDECNASPPRASLRLLPPSLPSFAERACWLCSDADAAMWTVGLRMIVAELARKPLSPVRCANSAPM